MHILNLKDAVMRARENFSGVATTRELDEVLGEIKTNSDDTAPPKRILRSPDEGPKTVHEVAIVLGIPDLAACIMRFAKSNGSTKLSDFPESIAALQKAEAQGLRMLQIPVPVLQDPELYINHNLRCTVSESFRGAI